MALMEVKVPDIGDFEAVEVIEVLVKPGDAIKAEQSLVTVESDKASMEIPSSHAGVVKELKVKLGDKVSEGTVVLVIDSADAAAPAPAVAAAPPAEPTAAPTASGPVEVVVPDIGDFDAVEVIELLVKPGDAVKAEQSLITVESDKASMEIPSSHAGTVERLLVKLGDKVSKGTPVVLRSEERRVGKECRRLCRSRWSPYH
jgi:pyruvate dehydrogenase E2 component (dihydrolipoamide acetyltransferase)